MVNSLAQNPGVLQKQASITEASITNVFPF